MIKSNVIELIGNTPMLRLDGVKERLGLKSSIFVKLEGCNPAGSAKDRVAYQMVLDGEASGKFVRGKTVIVEPTSGNTGIGLAMVAVPLGYRVIIVMPENMSEERKKLISALGAQLVLTDASLGMSGAISKAESIVKQTAGAHIAGQFENPSNPRAHYLTTGPEIWEQTDGKVDIFVSAIGTGGTISGTGKFLKQKNPSVRVVGVEPEDSPFITKGKSAPHKIQGIGAGFIPKTLDLGVVDEVLTASYEQCVRAVRLLRQTTGAMVGISSGASLSAAIALAMREENKDKNIVAIMPDGGERYLSTDLFD